MTIRARVGIPLRKVRDAEFISFRFPGHAAEDIAVMFPGWEKQKNPLVRVHSECLTGDVFASLRCDCGDQLNEAMDLMTKEGGILLYLRQEGRSIGLYNKLDAYHLQIENGMDTFEANTHLGFPADARNYRIAAMMLEDLGVKTIRLITNNPEKKKALAGYGIEVVETISAGHHASSDNAEYLLAKKKQGHTLSVS